MKNNIEYNFAEDLKVFKEILELNDKDIIEIFSIPKSSLYRYYKNDSIPPKDVLERIYNYIFNNGIVLSNIYEDVFKTKENKNNLILFHGSKEGIQGPLSLKYSNENRDFGKAFYLGESMQQAISFVSGYNESCAYIVSLKNISKLKIVEFDVSREWMIVVAYFRGRLSVYSGSKYLNKILKKIEKADIIISPISDNSMYSIINDFINGTITDLQCLNSLSANRLGKQYAILNEAVLNKNITLLKKIYISQDERTEYENKKEEDRNVGAAKMKLAMRKYAGKGLYIEELLENEK